MESIGGGGMKKSLVRYQAAEDVVSCALDLILLAFDNTMTSPGGLEHDSSCLFKLLQYTSLVLKKSCARWERGLLKANSSGKEGQSSKSVGANSNGALASMSDAYLDAPSAHLIFCLKTIQKVLVGASNSHALLRTMRRYCRSDLVPNFLFLTYRLFQFRRIGTHAW